MNQVENFSHLFVALDLTEFSKVVLAQARAISAASHAPLTLVHVVDNTHASSNIKSSEFEKIKSVVLKKFNSFYKIKKGERALVLNGRPFEQILQTVKKSKRPLIIVGHKNNEGGLSRFFLGSTTEKLALNSKYPIWVHKDDTALVPKKIMIASDFSKRTIRSLHTTLRLGFKKASIELHHVLQPVVPILDYSSWQVVTEEMQIENQKSLDRLRRRVSPLPVFESLNIDVASELIKRSRKYDLSVISAYAESHLFSGLDRNSTKLLRESIHSVLIVPGPAHSS